MNRLILTYQNWAKKSILDEVVIIAVMIAFIECIAQNFIKNSPLDGGKMLYFGLTFYILVGFLLHHAYHTFEMSKVNIYWSCISIISATLLGYFVYHENMTWKNFISVIFAILAIIFSSI